MGEGARIPPRKEKHANHHIHIDTQLARAIILNYDHDPDVYKVAKALESKGNTLTISLTALGEVFAGIGNAIEDGERISQEKLNGLSRRMFFMLEDKTISFCVLHKEDFAIVAKLLDAEPDIDATDALIVAHALGCESCDVFYTLDSTVIKSKAVARIAKENDVKILSLN